MNQDQRHEPDRRQEPTRVWGAFPPAGWRKRARRADEHRRPYFADRFPASSFVLIIVVLILCVVDAVLTLQLLLRGNEEGNPLMAYLLDHGMQSFLIGKYALTAAGLPLLLIFKNHYLFGTRFRVGYLLPIIVALYLLLIAYQTFLILGVPHQPG